MTLKKKTHRGGYPVENKGKRDRALRDQRGFSLLEVLIGATILAVGLLGAATMYPVAYVNVDSGGKLTEASALAQSFLEQLRTIGANNFDQMADDFPGPTCTTPTCGGFNGMSTATCQNAPIGSPQNLTCSAWRNALDVANGGQLPQAVGTVAIACQDGAGNPVPAAPPNDCDPPSQSGWLGIVSVTVTWADLRTPNRTVTLTTRVLRP